MYVFVIQTDAPDLYPPCGLRIAETDTRAGLIEEINHWFAECDDVEDFDLPETATDEQIFNAVQDAAGESDWSISGPSGYLGEAKSIDATEAAS